MTGGTKENRGWYVGLSAALRVCLEVIVFGLLDLHSRVLDWPGMRLSWENPLHPGTTFCMCIYMSDLSVVG